jgi:uncharacterized membrane protein
MKIQRAFLAATLVLAFAAWLFGVAYAQSSRTEGAPKVVVNTMTINAGDVIEGSLYEGSFKIMNTGNAELQILSVRPG